MTTPPTPASPIDRFFRLSANRTTVRAEVLGGATTFATMAYILVVNPAILAAAGFPPGPTTVATILVAVFGTLLMGLYANRPIAVAPYMGENAFIAFGLAALHVSVGQRLGAVFVSGVAFLVLTLTGTRAWLADAVAPSLKHAFAVAIGLFLAFIGLYETGVVTGFTRGLPAVALFPGNPAATMLTPMPAPAAPVKIGDLHDPQVLLAVGGFALMAALMVRRVRGAILIGIVATAAAGFLLPGHVVHLPHRVAAMPFAGPYSLAPIALQLDVRGVLRLSFLPLLLTLFLMSFLDTLGTMVAVGAAGDLLDAQGNFPDLKKPMLVDALSCTFASLVGTSTSGAFIESATGIKEGARTGLAAVVTAALFALCLPFIPLLEPVQQLAFAYGPALVMVGVLMLASARHLEFDDLTELVPAAATIAVTVFSYNVGNGLTAGLVLYPLLKLLSGRAREVKGGAWALGAACALYYVFGLPH